MLSHVFILVVSLLSVLGKPIEECNCALSPEGSKSCETPCTPEQSNIAELEEIPDTTGASAEEDAVTNRIIPDGSIEDSVEDGTDKSDEADQLSVANTLSTNAPNVEWDNQSSGEADNEAVEEPHDNGSSEETFTERAKGENGDQGDKQGHEQGDEQGDMNEQRDEQEDEQEIEQVAEHGEEQDNEQEEDQWVEQEDEQVDAQQDEEARQQVEQEAQQQAEAAWLRQRQAVQEQEALVTLMNIINYYQSLRGHQEQRYGYYS